MSSLKGQSTRDAVAPYKAAKILHDGKVRGHKLTSKQQRYMAVQASKKGKK